MATSPTTFLNIIFLNFALLFATPANSIEKDSKMLKLFEFWPAFFPQPTDSQIFQFFPQDFFCRAPFYEEFSTLANFDIFQFSGSARKIYHNLNPDKNLFDEENKFCFTLFFFVDIKNSKLPFNDKNSLWKISLVFHDIDLSPSNIEEIKSDFVLEKMLNTLKDNKKKCYRVTFDLSSLSEKNLLTLLEKKPTLKISYFNKFRILSLPQKIY